MKTLLATLVLIVGIFATGCSGTNADEPTTNTDGAAATQSGEPNADGSAAAPPTGPGENPPPPLQGE